MTGAADILILIPAAGASRRMGLRDKCLERIGDEPALRRAARLALSTGAGVLVSLPVSGPRLDGRVAALVGLAVESVGISAAEEGMAASLRAGARAAQVRGAKGLLILLPDMPEIDSGDLCALTDFFAEDPHRPARAATSDGRPGHPVILPAPLFADVMRLQGDTGARAILHAHPARLYPLVGDRALRDLDTAEDWDSWRAGARSGGPA